MTIRIAIVGLGKIARDQHVPAIAGNREFDLVATVDPAAEGVGGTPHFPTLDALIDSEVAPDAIAVCTPPQLRFPLAAQALRSGRHVLIEKPPCATLSEAEELVRIAAECERTLFAAWHSRYAAGVAPARAWLTGKRIDSVTIDWREDVRVWHPGQDWIFEPGGFGIFDPVINALSIATAILPSPLLVGAAELDVPANRAAPIAGSLNLHGHDGMPVRVNMDFLQEGEQTWDIRIATDAGEMVLQKGGSVLVTPESTNADEDREYAGIYTHFAQTIAAQTSEADLVPLRLVADAFMRARFHKVGEFHE